MKNTADLEITGIKPIRTAIIGTGNIGTDLLVKITRSPFLVCSLFAGRNLESVGSQFALERGIRVTDKSINAIIEDPGCCDIVFDSTSAAVHKKHAPVLKNLGKIVLDLTPAKIGKMCVPVINMDDCLREDNVNMITCGGQATIPIACAITKVHPETEYLEMVSTISSQSAGIGTRDNIDEFTQTTKDALAYFTGVRRTKALITLNPAQPPINMRSTVYALIPVPNMTHIEKRIFDMAEKVRQYVPGYQVIVGPVYKGGRLTVTVEVTGLGDYLPSYAGNLDIITCAAINAAEAFAKRMTQGKEMSL